MSITAETAAQSSIIDDFATAPSTVNFELIAGLHACVPFTNDYLAGYF